MLNHEDNLRGKKLGTCTLEKLIGKGGMGDVYLARQERPQRRVAVKILQPVPGNRETYKQFLARFQREANLIAKLEHINIMPIYEYGEQDGLAYLVMPYITGGSLRDLLARRGSLNLFEAFTYMQQAAAALDYAHAQGIIHRDLKPANFLLHADGRLIMADFGIARMLEDETHPGAGTTLTSTGMLVGTPEYMAPEMVRGEPIDHRADIYELGIILYQMLSGNVPFKGNTPLVVVAMHLQQPLPSLHRSKPSISPEVDAVIQIATAKMPSERFQSARAMIQALQQVVAKTSMQGSLSSIQPTVLSEPHSPPVLLVHPQSDTIAATPILSETLANSEPGFFSAPPHTPSPSPLPFQPQHRPSWLIVLTLLLTAMLVVGGVLIGLQLSRSNTVRGPGSGTSQAIRATLPSTYILTPTVSSPGTIAYPSYNDAESAISYYYTNKSDFRGKNIIQHFDSITYGRFVGPSDQPQFMACAEYQFALVSSPDVTQGTARHTFTFQYTNHSWGVIDMGNWNSC